MCILASQLHVTYNQRFCIYLDDGGDELFQEIVAQQRWPVMMDEVDQQALNVGAILIL